MKHFLYFLSFVLVSSALTLTSCKKETPEQPNEEEVITTLRYTLTPASGGTDIVLTFQDLDGDGGTIPVVTGGILQANDSYSGSLTLLNESVDPVEDITEEIDEENLEHQFFFSTTTAGLSIAYADADANGDPVGLQSLLTTGAAASGTITITLRHEPAKDATGVSAGDITNAGGETDIEVSFPITVQ